MKKIKLISYLVICCGLCSAQPKNPLFHALVLAENGGHHILFTRAFRPWLDQLAADSSFAIDYIENPKAIDDVFLSRYQLFIQLDYPPYGWGEKAEAAFKNYIEEGKGGWIGFHQTHRAR